MQSLSIEILQYLKNAEDETDFKFLAARFRSQFLAKLFGRPNHPFIEVPQAQPESAQAAHAPTGIAPSISVSQFRNLSQSETSDGLSGSLAASLRSHLSQSHLIRCTNEQSSSGPPVDYLVEGTIADNLDQAHITLNLVDRNSEQLMLSKTFQIRVDRLLQSIEEVTHEFAWNIIVRIRSQHYSIAKKMPVHERTPYMNLVFAHEAILSNFMTDFDAVEEACQGLEKQKAPQHLVDHMRGLSAMRRWIRNVDEQQLLEQSEENFESALENHIDYPPAVLGLALLNCYRRRFSNARIYFDRWAAFPHRTSIAALGQGLVGLALGDYEDAKKALAKAEKFEAKALLLSPIYSGLAHYLTRQYSDAVARINLRRSPFPDAVAIKMAAGCQVSGSGHKSMLQTGHNMLPSNLTSFRLERYPLADENAQKHLLEGLDMAGVKAVCQL